MKLPFLAALLAAPLSALAADPADPAAAVPPAEYRSAFEGQLQGVEEESIDWKKANADVGQFPRGHVDLLKWEEAGGATPPAAAPAARPAPAAPPAHGHQH